MVGDVIPPVVRKISAVALGHPVGSRGRWPEPTSSRSALKNRPLTTFAARDLDGLRARHLEVRMDPVVKLLTLCEDVVGGVRSWTVSDRPLSQSRR